MSPLNGTRCTADGKSMEIDAETGASVFLVVSGRSAPIVLSGSLVSASDARLVIDLAPEPANDAPDAVLSPFIPVEGDRRAEPRYPTWLDATVYSRSHPEGQPAVITDLALQGASIEVDEWTGDTFYRLVFEVNDELLQVECESIHSEPTWRGVLLHTRFVLVSPDQYEILEAVVAALRAIFGHAQETLATDRLGFLLV